MKNNTNQNVSKSKHAAEIWICKPYQEQVYKRADNLSVERTKKEVGVGEGENKNCP